MRERRRGVARATDREVGVVAAILVTSSEKAVAHRLGLSHSTVKHHTANTVEGGGGNDGAAGVHTGGAAAGP